MSAYSTLTEYLRLIRPLPPRPFERRFETGAGQQAQVDFAEFPVTFTAEPDIQRKVWLFSMVLGHSRWIWARFTPTPASLCFPVRGPSRENLAAPLDAPIAWNLHSCMSMQIKSLSKINSKRIK